MAALVMPRGASDETSARSGRMRRGLADRHPFHGGGGDDRPGCIHGSDRPGQVTAGLGCLAERLRQERRPGNGRPEASVRPMLE